MKDICQITMHYFPRSGGQDTYVQQLIDLFEKKELSHSVVQPVKSKVEYPKFVKTLLRVPLIKQLKSGSNWFWFNFALIFEKGFLKNHKILISHYAFHLKSLQFHKKVIVISHGVDWPDNPKNIFDKTKYLSARRAVSLNGKNIIIVANDSNFLRKMGYKIKPAQNFYEEIDENVWFVPNAVDLNYFKRSKKPREKIILVPRNIRKSRGVDIAIESFIKFSKKKKYNDFKLLIAGGPLKGDFYKKCFKLSKKNKNIKFLGNIDYKKMNDLYRKSMVTLIPTRNYEGTSLSALESIACGTPVISTKAGGLADLPTFKTTTRSSRMAKDLEIIINKSNDFAEKQYLTVKNIFNIKKWNQAWIKIISEEL